MKNVEDNLDEMKRIISGLKETLNPQMLRGFIDSFLMRKKRLEVYCSSIFTLLLGMSISSPLSFNRSGGIRILVSWIPTTMMTTCSTVCTACLQLELIQQDIQLDGVYC